MNKKTFFIHSPTITGAHGFTLIELMLTLVISTMIIAAISSVYVAQQKSQVTQDQVIEMQQNLRAAMNIFSSEIRMAGYRPPTAVNINPGIVTATSSRFRFTWDSNENDSLTTPLVDLNEDIEYGFSLADDADLDGFADNGAASLGRQVTNGGLAGGFQPIADNIVAIEFFYVLEDLSDNGAYDPPTTLTPTATEINDIRAVTVSILARADRPDQGFNNNMSYTTASGAIWNGFNDNFRRRLLVTTVYLRNIGL